MCRAAKSRDGKMQSQHRSRSEMTEPRRVERCGLHNPLAQFLISALRFLLSVLSPWLTRGRMRQNAVVSMRQTGQPFRQSYTNRRLSRYRQVPTHHQHLTRTAAPFLLQSQSEIDFDRYSTE